jgi:hypothetical protein
MARTALTKTTILGAYGDYTAADSADIVFDAGDVGNGNYFTFTADEILLAWNTGGSPYTITIDSVDDPFGRQEDIETYSIGAGEIAVFGPFKAVGWEQGDGNINVDVSNVAVELAVLTGVT